jgi:small nuclear ribonucleoprotein D2
MAEEATQGKKEEEEFSTGPLSVLMMSVKNNTQVGWCWDSSSSGV